MKSPKANPSEDGTGGSRPAQMPGFSDSAESIRVLRGELTVSEAEERERPRPRVLRASPFILISCGLAFLSLIFLLDFTSQTGQQVSDGRTGPNGPEKNQIVPAGVRENPSSMNAHATEAKPPVQTATTVVPTVEAATRVGKENEEAEKERAAPASQTPAVNNVEPPAATMPRPPALQTEGGFTLQVGSYNDSAQAQERVAKLGSAGVWANVIRVEIPRRGTWYRVQTGSFRSREEATRFGAQLRAKGAVADFIVTTL
ncbi:MAG TPA: SPOR domain-containing protein [Pyrinomonadaceae bacterium]|nr:SPOR domain-containing protein [Pyrinomonadaceae bacterium]